MTLPAAMPSVVAAARRKRLLARLHILRGELGMAEDVYRDLLQQRTGCRSAADLDAHVLDDWARHLQNLKDRGRRKHVKELTPMQAKAWSLWQQLADAGAVKDRRMAGLLGYVKTHITRVDHIEWLNGPQENLLIEQLKKWLARVQEP